MNDKPKDVPTLTDDQKCSRCGALAEIGYGLAGGGMGAYAYCENCEAILEKWQDADE